MFYDSIYMQGPENETVETEDRQWLPGAGCGNRD